MQRGFVEEIFTLPKLHLFFAQSSLIVAHREIAAALTGFLEERNGLVRLSELHQNRPFERGIWSSLAG